MQTIGKITICTNKLKIIKEYPAEIYRVTNHAISFTKECRGAEENTAAVTCTVPDSPMKDFLDA